MPDPVRIGRLRWPVFLVLRQQIPDPSSSGIIELPVQRILVHADIQPMGPVAFYGAVTAQGDQAPTHKITTRWLDNVDTRHAVIRLTGRPDASFRVEIFRIRRILGDLDGRKRFSVIEAQLESVTPFAGEDLAIAGPHAVPTVPQPAIGGGIQVGDYTLREDSAGNLVVVNPDGSSTTLVAK